MINRGLLLLKAVKLLAACAVVAWPPLAASQIAAPAEAPEEFVVVGRLPGPPLWRVYNGDHVLWIFPYLSPVPKDMIWESTKVEAVLAEAQEVLQMPDVDVDVPTLLMLNPLNYLRGMRLAKRLNRNPDGATLQQVLPPDLYARFAALKAAYFPDNDGFDEVRPLIAGGRLSYATQQAVGLESGADIMKKIRRLIRKQSGLKRTPIEVEMKIEGSFGSLADRAEAMMASLSSAQELACFEEQLRRMEQDLDAMKSRANSWAQGYVDEFRGVALPGTVDDVCTRMAFTSSESETIQDLLDRMDARWLEAAERALLTNQSTFAVLDITQLLQEDGLLAQLKAKGYEVREP